MSPGCVPQCKAGTPFAEMSQQLEMHISCSVILIYIYLESRTLICSEYAE